MFSYIGQSFWYYGRAALSVTVCIDLNKIGIIIVSVMKSKIYVNTGLVNQLMGGDHF